MIIPNSFIVKIDVNISLSGCMIWSLLVRQQHYCEIIVFWRNKISWELLRCSTRTHLDYNNVLPAWLVIPIHSRFALPFLPLVFVVTECTDAFSNRTVIKSVFIALCGHCSFLNSLLVSLRLFCFYNVNS